MLTQVLLYTCNNQNADEGDNAADERVSCLMYSQNDDVGVDASDIRVNLLMLQS